MSSDKADVERRKNKRFKVKDLAFAKLWSEHQADYVQDMGKLLDISREGLSLRCSLKTEKTGEGDEMAIFLSGNDFSVDKIPFNIISDIEMRSGLTSSKRTVWRYGIKFQDLTPRQMDKLDYFLLNHTSDEF